MPKLKLYIKALSPIINFSGETQNVFVLKNGKIYILDTKKLDKILSVMCLLGEFNEQYSFSKEKNVTQWLKKKKLLTSEILEEISYKKIECSLKDEINTITTFSNKFCNEQLFLEKFFKDCFFNIIAFDYIMKNKSRINEYVTNVIAFFKKNKILEYKEYPFLFFIDCLFETEKAKMYHEIEFENKFKIECILNKESSKYFGIEKIINNKKELFFECLKQDSLLEINILHNSNNKFCADLEKYLQIAEYMTLQKQKIEQVIEEKVIVRQEIFKIEKNYSSQANMCMMNLNQIFYLCLNSQNKIEINNLLSCNVKEMLFYYRKNSKKTIEGLNYFQIKKFDDEIYFIPSSK